MLKNILRLLFIIILLLLSYSYYFFWFKKNSINSSLANTELTNIKKVISEESPYYKLNKDEFNNLLNSFKIYNDKHQKISINTFTTQIEHLLGTLRDQHASYKMKDKYIKKELFLPFPIAPYKDTLVIALNENNHSSYQFLINGYPFIKKINDLYLGEIISKVSPINKYATKYAILQKGVENLQELKNLEIDKKIKITFTSPDLKNDTTIYCNPSQIKIDWEDKLPNFDNKKIIYRDINKNIAYIGISEMLNTKESKSEFKKLGVYLEKQKQAKALIIDIRNNEGGSRDLIHFFSNYLLAPKKNSLVSFGYINSKTKNIHTLEELKDREIYSLNKFQSPTDIEIIEETKKKIKSIIPINYNYAVASIMKSNNHSLYYEKPIFILVNENTFSSASVFASAFKGLPNITIVGVTTNGSSGLSKIYSFKTISIKFSTMLSFQKNGHLFDGVGTIPDITIERSLDYILSNKDNQLSETINIINSLKK